VLWPIFHYRIDLAEFSRRDLSGYLRVNDNFARHLDTVLRPDDLVWYTTITYCRLRKHSASVGAKIASAFSFIFRAPRPRC
jgi:trehalose 6-phosphate synthase